MTGGLLNDPHDPHRRLVDDESTRPMNWSHYYVVRPWYDYPIATNVDGFYPDPVDDKERRRRWAAWIGPAPKFSALLFARSAPLPAKFSQPRPVMRLPVRQHHRKMALAIPRRERRLAKLIPAGPRQRKYRTHYRHEAPTGLFF